MKEQDLTPSHENKLDSTVEPTTEKENTHDQSTNETTETAETKSTAESEPTQAETQPEAEVKPVQNQPDYAIMEKHELVIRLNLILEGDLNAEAKERVDKIKIHFYKKHNADLEELKRNFLSEGGLEHEFEPTIDTQETEMKKLLHAYRDRKATISQNLEKEKDANLEEKLGIIDDIKDLINGQESFEKTFSDFRILQQRWKDIGMVPSKKLKHLWESYHFIVESFYDYIKINRELRDMDLRKNYEAKVKLCESAEALLEEPSAIKAFNSLQKLHEQWREIGPVERDKRDALWEVFKKATSQINKNQQEFYNKIREEQVVNLEKKQDLCQQIEELSVKELNSHKSWNKVSQQILNIQQTWRTIGFTPKKDNNQIYQRFRDACDIFFNRKRDYYLEHKDKLSENLVLKIELCELAEKLKDSNDWKSTANELIRIQKKWKEIGAVPRKVSNELWDRFRLACDTFFNNKTAHFEGQDSEQLDNLKLKEDLILKIGEFELSKDNEVNILTIKQFQKEWSEIGHIPFKKKESLNNVYRDTVNKLYDSMNMDFEHKEIQKFTNKIESFLESKNPEDKVYTERNKISMRIKQLEADITQWETNMGFFSLSDSSSSLLKDFHVKIARGKNDISLLKAKIKIIDKLA